MNSDCIQVLFPADPQPYDGRSLALLASDIEKHSSGNPKSFNFWFYGCVHYRLSGSAVKKHTKPVLPIGLRAS
jgi:hypothetical protein